MSRNTGESFVRSYPPVMNVGRLVAVVVVTISDTALSALNDDVIIVLCASRYRYVIIIKYTGYDMIAIAGASITYELLCVLCCSCSRLFFGEASEGLVGDVELNLEVQDVDLERVHLLDQHSWLERVVGGTQRSAVVRADVQAGFQFAFLGGEVALQIVDQAFLFKLEAIGSLGCAADECRIGRACGQ